LRSLSTFLDLLSGRSRLSKWLAAGLGLACAAYAVHAKEPKKAMSQYGRERWGIDRGFPSGAVYAITQTPDGYLWIGTEKGLVRFDGLNFHLFQKSNTATGPVGPVLGLSVDSEDNLWITLQAGLLRYHEGKFEDASAYFKWPETTVTAMCRGKDGEAIFAALHNGIVRSGAGGPLTLASMPAMPNFLVLSIAEMADGRIFLGTRDAGLFQLNGGQYSAGPVELRDRKINCLLPSDKQELWIGTDNGLLRWNGKEFVNATIPRGLSHGQILALGKDRETNTWIGTAEGLFRMDSEGVSSRDEEPRPTGSGVTAIFEDREGNVWTGSTQGLERFRDTVFTTYSLPEGLPSDTNGPVYVDSDGRTWFAPSEGGLYWLKEGVVVGNVKSAGLDGDVVYSVTGDGGELWLGRKRGGLTHLRYGDGTWTSQTYTQAQGLSQNSVYAVHENDDGTVWAATVSGGVSKLKDGKFSNFTSADGLLSNSVAAITEGPDGTMWFATPRGLSAFSNGRWRFFTQKDGLPSEDVICLLEDSTGTLWLGTAKGLAWIRSGSVGALEGAPDSLHEPIYGIEQDRNGGLWIATANRVLRTDRVRLLQGKLGGDDLREYGLADGLRGTEGVKRNRSVVADRLGRIWFSMNRGISFVDPVRAMGSSVPALVHIEGISVDGTAINIQGDVRVPAAHQRVTFSYAGLTLSVPERVRFKYKLEGFDRDWSEPTVAREATYTNLSSDSYRFRVIASNSDGLWNSSESAIGFKIDPAFWQTWWFRLSSVLAVGLATLAFFRLRELRLTSQMNMRFEERLAERTRIAQELHDTLLQGFLSASMQLHVADDHIDADSPAKPYVRRVLELIGRVIDEGRNAVRGLRLANREPEDLEQALAGIQQEVGAAQETDFRVVAEGSARQLRPVIREEVYRIGREALVNAFRHSSASNVEVELEYAPSHLRLLVRDNGSGIDPQVINAGRDGHWGLSGMRERAERIGAKFRVLSGASAGTEVELSVPGHIAFEFPPSESPWGWLTKASPREAGEAKKRKSEKQK
jgi:signal transduction histidine kinase/ligand-binding sensor domain-containing protein